jgi:hypothetical protein
LHLNPTTRILKKVRIRTSLFTGLVFSISLYAQRPYEIHGYIQGRYTDNISTPDLLEIRRTRANITGEPIARLFYRFQMDVAKRPNLLDASIAWKFSPGLSLTAGQMKIPFSGENLIADNLNAPIARARAVTAFAPGRDTGMQGRDFGLQASGTIHRANGPIVEYAAGVFRGKLLVDGPKLHYKATAGRILVYPLHGLSVGADWYGSFSAPAGLVKRREAVEGEYNRGKHQLRAEQIWASDGILKRRGGYLLSTWRFAKHWEGLTRADWLTSDTRKPKAASIAYIAGANHFLWNHVKIGLDGGALHSRNPNAWSSVFFAQVLVYF